MATLEAQDHWPRRAREAFVLWTGVVASVWIGGLLVLPIDPGYTAGELLDHLLSWQETGVLYPGLVEPPYRVLNYPPLFLVLVDALTVLRIPALIAGRLLGTFGTLITLLVVHAWLREMGMDRRQALAGVALAGTSFPVLYSLGQVQFSGLAVASTLAGFWLSRKSGTAVVAAGVLLAIACFFKQTQVILSVVALLWVWKHRPRRDAIHVLAAYAATGVVGCALITLAFGTEAWRHMLTYSVGTFSVSQLALQLASFVLTWIVFVAFAFRLALRNRTSRADPRCWYLAGSGAWLLASARLGSSYAYFLDFHLAVLLWVAPLLFGESSPQLHPPEEMPERDSRDKAYALSAPVTVRASSDSLPGRLLGPALLLQVVLVAAGVAAVLGYNLVATHRTAENLTELCPHVRAAPALTVSGSPGMVRACGGRPAIHPFIMASLADQGLWDETDFLQSLSEGAFGVALLPFDPGTEPGGVDAERWTDGALTTFREDYQVIDEVERWWVLEPRR